MLEFIRQGKNSVKLEGGLDASPLDLSQDWMHEADNELLSK